MQLDVTFPPTLSAMMQSDARHRFILGPFGSGKSVGCQIDIPRRAAMQKRSPDGIRKSRFAVVRNTRPQLRDTTIKTWLDWLPNGSIGTWNSTSLTYTIRVDDVLSEVVFRPLDDAADVKNLLSFELTGAYINECRDIAREITEGLDGRIGRYPRTEDGGPSWMGIWGDTNMPEEETYWWAMFEGRNPNDFKLEEHNEWKVFRQPPAMFRQMDGSLILNPDAENLANLPPGYYVNLSKNKTDEYLRVYVLCEYGRSKGGKPVQPAFNRDLHVSRTRLIPDKNNLLLVSADFGLTPAMVLKQQDALGRVLTMDEVVCFDMGLERAIETRLLPLMRQKYDGFEVFVTGDPSGEKRSDGDETSCVDIFKQYRRKGLGRVKLAFSNSPVHRQGATAHFLAMLGDRGRPIYQVDPGCSWLIQALSGKYMFKKYKDGRHSEEVDKNEWSHVGEANEYGDMYWFRGGRRKAEQQERDEYLYALRQQQSGNQYSMPR